MRSLYTSEEARNAWLAGHDLHGLPPDLVDFLPFYERRRAIVRERLTKLLGARPDEIRLAATESPPRQPLPESDATPPPPVAAEHERAASKAATTGMKRYYATGLADLIGQGGLTPGAVLRKTYRGADYAVVVRPDGRLEGDGQVYDSPSQAARLMTGQKAVNGWAFWLTDAGAPVGDLRRDTE